MGHLSSATTEVWGTSLLPCNNRAIDLIECSKLSDPVEALQLTFLRYFLGLNKYSSSWAVLSESGRPPIKLFIFRHIVKFWKHLSETTNPILNAALEASGELHLDNYNSWFDGFFKILHWANVEHILYP